MNEEKQDDLNKYALSLRKLRPHLFRYTPNIKYQSNKTTEDKAKPINQEEEQ